MKTLKVLLAAFLAFTLSASFAQDNTISNSNNIKATVNSGNFVFRAQSVSPETGIVRQLTSPFVLSVSNIDIVSDLPYYGRAYSAPVDPTQGNLQFTSKNFQYDAKQYTRRNHKTAWHITIKPKDTAGDGLTMFLTIYEDGTASLDISSETRQSVSFSGYIETKG